MQKDSMDSQKWPQRGKKLFLPKIEYNRLENTTESWNTAQLNSDSHEFIVQETIEDNDSEGFISPSPMAADQDDRTGGFFTKFSVLPPIQGQQSSKGIPSHRDKRNFENVSDPISSGRGSYHKRKADGFLHKQTVILTGEGITLQTTNTDNLKIVGKRYSGLNMQNHQQTPDETTDEKNRTGNILSRPSTTPDVSHPLVLGSKPSPLSDNENKNIGLIPQANRSCPQLGRRRLSKLRRFNSDTSNEGQNGTSVVLNSMHKRADHSLLTRANLPKASLLINPSENTGVNEKNGFISICRSPRPISRCHIDINMNESENINVNLMEDRKVGPSNLFDTTMSADVMSSEPFIQMPTEQYSSSGGRRESQNPPSIQILINSLDSAKEEILRNEKMELPKMSIREQRRRSALCRANSKQVDDFLLVHNLKDLGLL